MLKKDGIYALGPGVRIGPVALSVAVVPCPRQAVIC